MAKRLPYFLSLLLVGNLYLLFLIFWPSIEQIRQQVEESEAVLTTVDEPIYHDYYFDYRYIGSQREGAWDVALYQEVKVVLGKEGEKAAEIPTGRWEYQRLYRDVP